MIIKGGSRGNPRWLGNHLSRTDTNERIEVLEVQSPHDETLSAKERLTETFRDWQFLCGGTRGEDGLYHANIDPAEDYAMTPEQWRRSVEVLEKELGLEGQPRAVVLHEKKGRQHVHVVWCRCDVNTMTLRSDSYNFNAHERASLKLEHEFGHEIVPGKHAKRDRERQPEPPKSEFNHAEWQQAERAGVSPREHKAALTKLMAQSDSGTAFKSAIEDAGYLLAKGDRRDFVAVDARGKIHSLGRIKGMRAAEVRNLMADVSQDALPTAAQAVEQQRQRAQAAADEAAKAEASEAKLRDASSDDEAALRARLAEHYEEEREALRLQQRHTLIQHGVVDRAALDRLAAKPLKVEKPKEPSGMERFWREVRETFSPRLRRAREEAEARRADDFKAEQERARQAKIAALEREQAIRREQTHESHAAAMRELEARQAADLERRIQDAGEAKRMAHEIELERQRREELARQREGPAQGPPRAG